ncbi:uncharacterized protein PODANS_6_7960 [Podospora anserina S mat+]|uniref:Podospora anserina S mat+ genomic DNA chromosome 6, supercontig 2 n=1 Tax=Podospora anserina (strain S / ATCC MYA-4624 / DSM 980 / FGSC 10383) TaxID=515849 RepID=B2B422_PODAN|nr:uncharacterized protein PODANS_6_7960 [Podospora anserina S mat+]CAP71858.1 unnamed protein product [Podospora anserina S mat+]CDP31249.1 Putative protein of unknown function [Podospora anserina S mat+]
MAIGLSIPQSRPASLVNRVRIVAPVCPPAPESRRRADSSSPDNYPPSPPSAFHVAPPRPPLWPEITADGLPAAYRYHEAPRKRVVGNPANDILAFLRTELSLGGLADMLKHLWFAGAERPATPLHFHVSMGREVAIADRMDLHLLWSNKGRLFIKPVPRFLLNPAFCRSNLQCPDGCACYNPPADTCRGIARKVALGFLYTYALAREVLQVHERDPDVVHPRFLRAELRLSRINTIHRFTRLPPFHPYVRDWHNYSSLFHDNLAWMATAAVFLALVLTAMQVGLATERLQQDTTFQQASYGFTVFAILGPICAFGLVALGTLFNLVNDLPLLIGRRRNCAVHETSGELSSTSAPAAASTSSSPINISSCFNSSFLAKLYSIKRPESISQPRTFPDSLWFREPIPCNTRLGSRCVRMLFVGQGLGFGGTGYYITRCLTISRPFPQAQWGVTRPGTCYLNRKSRRPITFVRAWTSKKL